MKCLEVKTLDFPDRSRVVVADLIDPDTILARYWFIKRKWRRTRENTIIQMGIKHRGFQHKNSEWSQWNHFWADKKPISNNW